MDYRNAIKWYQYDPTKWFIWFCYKVGLATHLKVRSNSEDAFDICLLTSFYQVFPENEVRKGQLTMQLKKLRETQDHLSWPVDSTDLPVVSWESC